MTTFFLALQQEQYGPILEDAVLDELKGLGDVVLAESLVHEDTDGYAQKIADSGAEVLLSCWGSPQLTNDGLKKNAQLKYMVHLAGEVRRYVARECIEQGLIVTNWGTVIARTVAEASLMMILCGLRRTTAFQLELHQRKGWRPEHLVTQSLFERSVGLHGLGAISQELVKLLKPFDVDIEAYSPNAPDSVFDSLGIRRQSTLEALYSDNDVISVHASNTPENHHIVNAKILAGMKDGGVLVNTARGGVIDTSALVDALKTGRISACLDVYEEEPLPADHPLRGIENCQLIPHCGGPTPDRRVDMGRQALRNIKRYLAGEELEFGIDLRRYDLIT